MCSRNPLDPSPPPPPPGWPVPQITLLSNKKLAGIISATAFLPPTPLHACASVPYQELSQGKFDWRWLFAHVKWSLLATIQPLECFASEEHNQREDLHNTCRRDSWLVQCAPVCILHQDQSAPVTSVHQDQYAPENWPAVWMSNGGGTLCAGVGRTLGRSYLNPTDAFVAWFPRGYPA